MDEALLECVPNVSEGRDAKVIAALSEAIAAVPEVSLLHVDSEPSANRTVFTFIGRPKGVIEAAFRLCEAAAERIDMRIHEGAHPRLGVVDVCPVIPYQGLTMQDAVRSSYELGTRLGSELGIPVYCYENSARIPERRKLANIRSGQYEGLALKLQDPAWKPDFGPEEFQPQWGATVVGARSFLIAFNVNLETNELAIAREIAYSIRESGPPANYKHLQSERVFLPSCRAIGWYLQERGRVQVSCNLTNFETTGLWKCYSACDRIATLLGTKVTGSELVGMLPKAALVSAGKLASAMHPSGKYSEERDLMEVAVEKLGLDEFSPFRAHERVLELRLEDLHGK